MRAHSLAEGLLRDTDGEEAARALAGDRPTAQWARFSAGEADFPGQRRERVRVFLGEELTDAEADAWFQRYIAHYEAAWALFPDVLPVLDALAASHRHAVLSNSSLRVQDRKLRVLGVHDRFEAILCAAELGVSKPEAGAFLAACEALGLPPHQVAYVGDHPEIDGAGRRRRRTARRCGSTGTACHRRPRPRRPAPDRLARRTPRAPRRRYPFWSPVHLRVMFFLRRRERAERPGPGSAS